MTRRALVWTHDLVGNRTGVISRDFLEIKTDDTLDGASRLEFIIPARHPKRYLLVLDSDLVYAGRRYYIDEIIEDRTGPRIEVTVKANAYWYRLGQFDVLGSLVITDRDPLKGLDAILTGTGWQARDAPQTSDVFSLEQESRSALDLIHTWAKVTGTYPRFDTLAKTVSLATSTGASRGITFRAGRNLRNLQRRTTAPEVTDLVAYGANGITIATLNGGDVNLEDYSFYLDQGLNQAQARALFHKRKVWINSSYVTPRDLLEAARARLARLAQSVQKVELDVVDISSLTGIAEPLDVGDNVTAYDPDLDEEFVAFVTRLVAYPLEPHRNVVELDASPDILQDPNTGTGASTAPLSQQWVLLIGPIQGVSIRDDVEASVGEISVEFIAGARAHFHVDVWAVGVGDGTMHVRVIDTEANDEQHYRQVDVPYTDGNTVRASYEWAAINLADGVYTFELMVSTTASGGPDPALGVDIAADEIDPEKVGYWIFAMGAASAAPSTGYPSDYDLIVLTLPDAIWFAPGDTTLTIPVDEYADEVGNAGPPIWYSPADEINPV